MPAKKASKQPTSKQAVGKQRGAGKAARSKGAAKQGGSKKLGTSVKQGAAKKRGGKQAAKKGGKQAAKQGGAKGKGGARKSIVRRVLAGAAAGLVSGVTATVLPPLEKQAGIEPSGGGQQESGAGDDE